MPNKLLDENTGYNSLPVLLIEIDHPFLFYLIVGVEDGDIE
jgi:hypothetical protein